MTLVVSPPWANVTLNGKEIGPAGDTGRLEVALPANDAAMAWLEVSAEGYHTIRRPLSTYGGVNNVSVELVPMPFRATIRTTPPRAEIWMENELKGYSPLTLTLLPSERPTITVKHPGHAEISRQINPPTHGEIVELDIPLPAANIVMQVQSEPPGAMIATDGIVRGPTPLALELDPTYLGKDVEVTATLAGYEVAATELVLPAKATSEPVAVTLSLTPKKATVEVWTTPPGGRVSVGGEDIGTAPVTVKFDAGQIGSQVLVSASLGTSHFGKQEVTIPPLDEPVRVTIPLALGAQRVVLILSCPMEKASPKARANAVSMGALPLTATGFADRVVLIDQLIDVLHDLSAEQRFAVLIETADEIEAWPGGMETQAATHEQKTRAYDIVRSARPLGLGRTSDALRQALNFDPDTIWLFTTGDIPRQTLDAFSELPRSETVTVHIVRTNAAEQDGWLRDWTSRRQGTLTVLGRDAPPSIALGQQ